MLSTDPPLPPKAAPDPVVPVAALGSQTLLLCHLGTELRHGRGGVALLDHRETEPNPPRSTPKMRKTSGDSRELTSRCVSHGRCTMTPSDAVDHGSPTGEPTVHSLERRLRKLTFSPLVANTCRPPLTATPNTTSRLGELLFFPAFKGFPYWQTMETPFPC